MYTFTLYHALKDLRLQETLAKDPLGNWHTLYVIRDASFLFYIGRSIHPIERLFEHLGERNRLHLPDLLGNVILDNLPESYQWSYDLLMPSEHEDYLQKYTTTPSQVYPLFGTFDRLADDTQTAEKELIWYLSPCLNGTSKAIDIALPDRYYKQRSPIANKGMRGTSLAVEE